MNDKPPSLLTNPSVEMREFALKLADFDLSRALLLKGADEIEQARRTGAFWKAEKIASESEIARLRAALERIISYSLLEGSKAADWMRETARDALSGEPPSPAEPTARRSGELLPCENCGHGIVAHVQNGGNCPTPPLKSSADPNDYCRYCGTRRAEHELHSHPFR